MIDENKNLRIVFDFDASAKNTKTMKSLNDCLHRGPVVLLENVWALLLNFRLFKMGIIAELEEAFL